MSDRGPSGRSSGPHKPCSAAGIQNVEQTVSPEWSQGADQFSRNIIFKRADDVFIEFRAHSDQKSLATDSTQRLY